MLKHFLSSYELFHSLCQVFLLLYCDNNVLKSIHFRCIIRTNVSVQLTPKWVCRSHQNGCAAHTKMGVHVTPK